MTPDQREHMNSVFDGLLPLIDAAQALVPSDTGLPHQGLESHTEPPQYGHATAPDLLDRSPDWQDKSWQEILSDLVAANPQIEVPEQWRVSVRVDIYQSGAGLGYVICAAVLIDGVRWERRVNRGPLTWTEHDWREVVPDDEVLA